MSSQVMLNQKLGIQTSYNNQPISFKFLKWFASLNLEKLKGEGKCKIQKLYLQMNLIQMCLAMIFILQFLIIS